MSHSFSVSDWPALPGTVVERGEVAIELAHDLVQHAFGDGRVAAVAVEGLLLLVQVLHHVGLQVGARRHVHDLEDRGQRVVMIDGVRARHQLAETAEQVLQPQVGPDAFVERIFVQDHAGGPWVLRKATHHSPKLARHALHVVP